MAMGIYVREGRKPSGVYFWLVESHREGQKVIQKRLKYLGKQRPSPDELERLKLEYQGKIAKPKGKEDK